MATPRRAGQAQPLPSTFGCGSAALRYPADSRGAMGAGVVIRGGVFPQPLQPGFFHTFVSRGRIAPHPAEPRYPGFLTTVLEWRSFSPAIPMLLH